MRMTAATDFGGIISSLGGWTTITPSGLLIVVVMLFMLGRIFPLSTLKRAWDSADRAWAAYNLEREARIKAEANSVKALEAIRENNRILDNLRPKQGGDRERRQEEVDVALADRQGD